MRIAFFAERPISIINPTVAKMSFSNDRKVRAKYAPRIATGVLSRTLNGKVQLS